MIDTVRAEAFKLRTLTSVLFTCLATAALTVGLAWLSGWSVGRALTDNPGLLVGEVVPEQSGFDAISYGQAGMVVLGVLAVGTEYTGGQIRASLLAVPHRPRLLLAKAAAVAAAALAVALATVPAAFAATQVGLGEHGYPLTGMLDRPVLGALAGAVAYWVLLALLAAGITVVLRNTVVPLVLLISLVLALSFYLSMLTGLADLLPDRAGAQMFLRGGPNRTDLSAIGGGAVMAAWVAGVWAVAVPLFARRAA
ncbi:ABC transporter permease [Nocardiopsis sp. NPDC006198]|uniref:ABC transporter permease n=1 Tax=Streptomonospora nanhaiensis TaxID=1323731 RepID=A0ABY6YJT5_9ACTN|nr:ABC transporter permease [Streptomonospora nanhaiensis]WAE72569.1 ABC transporter permease [Streptomonospora nanhaiensis]